VKFERLELGRFLTARAAPNAALFFVDELLIQSKADYRQLRRFWLNVTYFVMLQDKP
jgi:hypothetical protein